MSLVLNPATWAPVLLAGAFFALLPFGRASNLPMLLMAIAGGVVLWRGGRALMMQAPYRLFGALFLCIWIPVLISVPDSVRVDISLKTALLFPYVYLVGLFLIHVFQHAVARERLLRVVAWVLLFWVADVLLQAAIGVDVFGFEPKRERLQGPFGEESLNMGIALAMLSPLLFAHVWNAWPRAWLLPVVLAVTAVIVLSATRTAWVIYLLVLLGAGVFIGRAAGLRLWRWGMIALLGLTLAGALAYRAVPVVQDRMQETLTALNGGFEQIDEATSMRLSLWQGAWRVIQAHPFNGAGAQTFRYAYPRYAPADDPMVFTDDKGQVTGAIYAHQVLLEVASETGVVGLLGLLLFYVGLLRRYPGSAAAAHWPFWLGLMAWLFPLSTHTAFYSTYWGHVIWCLVALNVAQLPGARAEVNDATGSGETPCRT